jgi:hypothetical protein
MSLTLAIILMFIAPSALSFIIITVLRNEKEKKTIVDAPIKPTETSVKEILNSTLSHVPLGCMWNVERVVKTYRKVGKEYIFDGSAETVYVSVALIAPTGPFKSFSIPLEDNEWWLHNFQAALKNNVRIVLQEYGETKVKESTKQKHFDDWDGVYS